MVLKKPTLALPSKRHRIPSCLSTWAFFGPQTLGSKRCTLCFFLGPVRQILTSKKHQKTSSSPLKDLMNSMRKWSSSSTLLQDASPCQDSAWWLWWTTLSPSTALEKKTYLQRDSTSSLPGGTGFSQKYHKHSQGVQVFCNLVEPAWERTGGLCGWWTWESTAPGRVRRTGDNILNSLVLFTPKLWVWLVHSLVSLQPYAVKSSVHGICHRLTWFSLEKWPSCFREEG